PKTAHAYHPDAKREVSRRIDALATVGRNPAPDHLRFTTWTLKYNRMNWLVLDELDHHWEQARVEAQLDRTGQYVQLTTKNVAALTLSFEPGLCPLDNARPPKVLIDGRTVTAAPILSDRSWSAHFRRGDGKWEPADDLTKDLSLRKRHDLQ